LQVPILSLPVFGAKLTHLDLLSGCGREDRTLADVGAKDNDVGSGKEGWVLRAKGSVLRTIIS